MAFILSAALLVPNAGLLERKVSAAGASVAVNEANFPDDAFREYVTKNFDKDSNGVLSETEIGGVTKIDIEDEDAESLKGIEYFPGLTELVCSDNKITELDLSKNTGLQVVVCDNNRLTKINVNGCSKLSVLFCYDNFLTSLDLRPCKNLTLAVCHRNNLTSVNITGLSQLSDAYFSDNMLTALDVSGCTKLECLDAAYNQLESLDVSENTGITELCVDFNQIASLDVSGLSKLKSLDCRNNYMKELKVGNCSGLQELSCADNNLTSLDISTCSSLSYLYCACNKLTSLDVSKNTGLTTLICVDNEISSLDVTRCTQLESLSAFSNNISSIDVSKCTKLRQISVMKTPVGSIDLSKCPEIKYINRGCNTTVTGVSDSASIMDEEYHSFTEDGWSGSGGNYNQYCGRCGKVAASVSRIAGADRYSTSLAAADELKKVMGVSKFGCIVVACGTNYADALSGSYLAYINNAPIILTANNAEVMNNTFNYIKSNLKSGGKVYILGGESVVSGDFEKLIKNAGISYKRLAGSDRYETNMEILKESGFKKNMILTVCTGRNFADCLSASAGRTPILLVPARMTDKQKEYLDSIGSFTALILGGKGAVTGYVEKDIMKYDSSVERIAGRDRFETSVLYAKECFRSTETAMLVYSQNFPDGLSAGPIAAYLGAPLILTVNSEKWVDVAASFYAQLFETITKTYVFGGPSLISDANVFKIVSTK